MEAYENWFEALPLAERIRLRKLGLDKPKLESRGGFSRQRGDDDENEFDDPADLAIDTRHPIAELDDSTIEESDLAEICEAFSAALIWAGQAKSLVEMGWRLTSMLHLMRPALLEGMALEIKRGQVAELASAMGGKRDLISKVGDHFRQVLAWCRRTDSLAQLGQRGFAMIYVIKRAAIGGRTNAALGGLNNKTRQAFNKTVQDFRDSNSGFRNEVMRSDETRRRCRKAQTIFAT